MNDTLETILVGFGTGLIAWVARGLYTKYFELKPRLYLRLEQTITKSGFASNKAFYELMWKNNFILKNNSSYTAYNIKFYIPFKEKLIHNEPEFRNNFPPNSHLESLEEKVASIKTTNSINSSEIFTVIDGEQVKKIDKPIIHFKPIELENFNILIEYENEKGKKFYTEYINKMNKISNWKWRKYKKYNA
ncbi:hypothetical protein ACFLS4_06710 [Bacteroidota bacterium]